MPHKMLHNEPQKVWSHHRVTLSMFAFRRKHSYIPRHCYCCKRTSVFKQALDSQAGGCATGDGGHSWDTGDTGDTENTGETGDTENTGDTGDGGHREHRGNRRDRADWVKKIRHEVKPLPSYGSNKL